MELLFDESNIRHWADQYLEDLNKKEEFEEQELLNLEFKVTQRSYLIKEELVKVVEWKLKSLVKKAS